MKGDTMRLLSGLLLAATLGLHGTANAVVQPGGDLPGDAGAERRAYERAIGRLRNGDTEGGYGALCKVIDAPAFEALSDTERHAALYLAGVEGYVLNDYRRSHEFLIRSTAMAQANGEDWTSRLNTALADGDKEDAVLALTHVARTWPATLRQFRAQPVLELARASAKFKDKSAQYDLLQALFAAEFRADLGQQPDYLWQKLSLMRLEHGDEAGAAAVAAKIISTEVLIAMRTDNRYAALVKADPGRYDIDKAATAEAKSRRELVAEHPRSLEALMQLGYALLLTREYGEMLKSCDTALERIRAAPKDAPAYDDEDKYRVWVMDNRARAQKRLGQWDEALAELEHAARRPENGGMNVSQAINLGDQYVEMSRPKDALEAVADVGQMSPFGEMQLQGVRHAAAVQLKDTAAADAAMKFLRDHRDDAADAYMEALLVEDRLDEAAADLIARLADPETRADALRGVQQYKEPPGPEWLMKLQASRARLIARPDVQAAVAKVGRAEIFKIGAPPG